ncbi:hypothetical protein C2W64_00424 [Brevibacillus laterosporus]|nr:hypothetical protein C2W64_00424 [Brevibacillus laterosporus]
MYVNALAGESIEGLGPTVCFLSTINALGAGDLFFLCQIVNKMTPP